MPRLECSFALSDLRCLSACWRCQISGLDRWRWSRVPLKGVSVAEAVEEQRCSRVIIKNEGSLVGGR